MKKTFVALAVLAVSGASFAQVTINGKLGFSYQKNASIVGGSANHGMAMSDGDLNFTAMEDLGGGIKAIAKSAFTSRGRDSTIGARDATLTLAMPAATMTVGAVESCSTILNTAGAPVALASGHDSAGAPIDGCANVDAFILSIPVGPVTLGLNYADSIARFVNGVPATSPGGAGDLTSNGVSVSYAAGPLSAGLDFTVFAANAAVQAALPTAGGGTYWDGLTRTRLFGAYDLGVAKIGAGFQVSNHDKASQSSLSVAVPLGAVSLGLVHSMRSAQGTSTYTGLTAADSRSGTAVGATYNLSKLTNINASYSTYSNTAQLDNEFRLRLMKAF